MCSNESDWYSMTGPDDLDYEIPEDKYDRFVFLREQVENSKTEFEREDFMVLFQEEFSDYLE